MEVYIFIEFRSKEPSRNKLMFLSWLSYIDIFFRFYLTKAEAVDSKSEGLHSKAVRRGQKQGEHGSAGGFVHL